MLKAERRRRIFDIPLLARGLRLGILRLARALTVAAAK
jgi:hypothetical protein